MRPSLCARLSHTRLRSLPPYPLYLHYTSSRADHIAYCPYALFRLSQSARPLLPTQPTRGHNRDRFLCSPVVLLPILGRRLPPSFDLNAAIVPANKAGPDHLAYAIANSLPACTPHRTSRHSFLYRRHLRSQSSWIHLLEYHHQSTTICRSDIHSLIH